MPLGSGVKVSVNASTTKCHVEFKRNTRSNILPNSLFFFLPHATSLFRVDAALFLSCCRRLSFPQRESSQEDGDAGVLEDDISLSFSELPPEFHGSDALAAHLLHAACGGELHMDGCVPR